MVNGYLCEILVRGQKTIVLLIAYYHAAAGYPVKSTWLTLDTQSNPPGSLLFERAISPLGPASPQLTYQNITPTQLPHKKVT